jgi:hypothetical protein
VSCQGLNNVVNGFAKMGYRPSKVFWAAFTPQVLAQLHTFKPQELAITLNAYARIGWHPGDDFFDQVTQQVRRHALSCDSGLQPE